MALHSVNGLGPVRLKALLDYFKDPKTVWQAEEKEFLQIGIPKNTVELLISTRKKLDPEDYQKYIEKSGISWLTIFDQDYPKLLKEIYDPPTVLYYKGEILPEDGKALGVVGTRKVSGYGRLVTEKLVAELAGAGVTIVSGLAWGVDSVAHQTAVREKGRTLAVLGGGLNNIFPPENTQLAEKIADGFGAVLSEFPPDSPSLPGNFPARNRIISGLSRAVLVTEAAEDSGSLITAKCALEQGRDVFAVPGPITSELSRGPLVLIKEGALLVTSADEILQELGMDKIPNSKSRILNNAALGETEQKIVDFLANGSKHVDEVCRELKIPGAVASASLVKMEILGVVKNLGSGIFTLG